MKPQDRHIHPIADRLLQRADKEALLGQRGCVLWMTGLSGSGKSTLAIGLERLLHENGILVQVLDGDNIRAGINSDLGFSEADRSENIRRIAEIAKLFAHNGVVTICCFVSPTQAIRERAKAIIGTDMRSRNLACQRVEARLGCKILNTMTDLGMPESHQVG